MNVLPSSWKQRMFRIRPKATGEYIGAKYVNPAWIPGG